MSEILVFSTLIMLLYVPRKKIYYDSLDKPPSPPTYAQLPVMEVVKAKSPLLSSTSAI